MLLDDVRKTIEATLDTLTPANAQKLAKSLLDPGVAKEQVAKSAADLLEWSQHNRERMREIVGREIQAQLHMVGAAPQTELDALKKRVRELERAAGMTASGRKKATGAQKVATAKPASAKAASRAKASGRKTSGPKTSGPKASATRKSTAASASEARPA